MQITSSHLDKITKLCRQEMIYLHSLTTPTLQKQQKKKKNNNNKKHGYNPINVY